MKNKIFNLYGLAILISLPIIIMQVFYFVKIEDPIYMWDSKAYWLTWENFSRLAVNAPWRWFKANLASINGNDYNSTPIALLFPFYFLPAASRFLYVFAVSICYFLPTVILTLWIFNRLERDKTFWWKMFIIIAIVTYSPFWKPTLRGYPDIVGLLGVESAIIYSIKNNMTSRLNLKVVLVLGLLMWTPFLFRRWYAYTVVSLYMTLPFLNYMLFVVNGREKILQFKNVLLNFLCSGVVSIIFAVIFQLSLLRRIIHTDYSYIYSAYQSDFLTSTNNVIHNGGLYIVPFLLIGAVWCVSKNRSTEKDFCLFCVANLLISFFIFTRTQSPGIQHCLPFSLWIFFISIFGFRRVLEFIRNDFLKRSLILASSIACFLVFFSTFNEIKGRPLLDNNYLPAKNYPFHIDNFGNYQDLATALEKLTSHGDKLLVLSSSGLLSDDLVSTLTQGRIDDHLDSASQVDLRDRLRLWGFQARYVVVADPIQIHLPPEGQRVIVIPAKEILSGTGIGAAYKRMPMEFHLSNGVIAHVFEKNRPFTFDEATNFISKFTDLYPDWKDAYLNPLAESYLTASITTGDIWGNFEIDSDGKKIYAHPGEHTPTVAEWYFGDIRSLTFRMANRSCPAADGVVVQLENADGARVRIDLPNDASRKIITSDFSRKMGKIIIDKNQNSFCDKVEITEE